MFIFNQYKTKILTKFNSHFSCIVFKIKHFKIICNDNKNYCRKRQSLTKFRLLLITVLLLYSQTKGVKQKYILYISGSVAYRQYIHKCSSPQDPYWLTAVSQLSAPQLPWTYLHCGSPLLSLVSAMTHRR